MNRLISGAELPIDALAGLSEAQRSYLDEFTFIQSGPEFIQGWYAGELLAIWDGKEWSQKCRVLHGRDER